MNKFRKRIQKANCPIHSALVIGTGFGNISDIADTYTSVFLTAMPEPVFKAKNVIFREDLNGLEQIKDITTVFVDKGTLEYLDKLSTIMMQVKPVIFIEGNDVIEREFSGPLYKNGYRVVDQKGYFHVWKKL